MTPGEAAYIMWRGLIPHTGTIWRWDDLPSTAKSGWEEIAKAAVRAWERRSEYSRLPYE